jgi:hypothetical protein
MKSSNKIKLCWQRTDRWKKTLEFEITSDKIVESTAKKDTAEELES